MKTAILSEIVRGQISIGSVVRSTAESDASHFSENDLFVLVLSEPHSKYVSPACLDPYNASVWDVKILVGNPWNITSKELKSDKDFKFVLMFNTLKEYYAERENLIATGKLSVNNASKSERIEQDASDEGDGDSNDGECDDEGDGDSNDDSETKIRSTVSECNSSTIELMNAECSRVAHLGGTFRIRQLPSSMTEYVITYPASYSKDV